MEDALKWYSENEEVYSQAEQSVVQYQGLSFLSVAYNALNEPEKAQFFTDRIAELRSKDPRKLEAYLADPHINFSKWGQFESRKREKE
jgi:hypothetical protein